MDVKQVTDKILQNLTNSADNYERWDALTPTDADYLMYSPLPVGYNTTAEQRFLMQNLLVGFNGGSLLDIGCGRCDLYAVARELAALNDTIVFYNAIDHNPMMTQLGEEKCYVMDTSSRKNRRRLDRIMCQSSIRSLPRPKSALCKT